jgi:hypothetical protein
MTDAQDGRPCDFANLSLETLRARANYRRETAARLWDDRLEQLLLDEAAELDKCADALELQAAIGADAHRQDKAAARKDAVALHKSLTTR